MMFEKYCTVVENTHCPSNTQSICCSMRQFGSSHKKDGGTRRTFEGGGVEKVVLVPLWVFSLKKSSVEGLKIAIPFWVLSRKIDRNSYVVLELVLLRCEKKFKPRL